MPRCAHKRSYSGSEGDDCVEVAHALGVVHVRDSKEKDGSQLVICTVAWRDFVGRVER
ncbi:DUF397 domain-containing protein [Streptomyces sp. Vc74B-19]|uniref:DUF397 domain-containing protein n=1 Tax=unclassified Streptomyces TaxID=2593676 RepID=UPI001BFC8379|nr:MULTISPECIES: DUF397 domain-containing protein [unclassified Streptomyces]MBT3166686.1 DUF397 domain-containing protein [Streptomyces sp. Vc74B-19]MCO4699250.1 hypothetical protein [Streptomyces sp. RO-S4]MDU0299531.1 DUF397 domain-containing protein [Streptomyces sp. PAL114]